MRTTATFMVAALVLAPLAARAQNQTPPNDTPAATSTAPGKPGLTLPDLREVNYIDFGARATFFGSNSDEARFQRYRDLRNGPTLDILRYTGETDRHLFKVQADHVGYRDQRYAISYNQFGKLKASFEWNQIPLFYSKDTRTLYSSGGPGVLLLDDAIQTGLQNRTTTLAGAAAGATQFDMLLKRYIADFKMTYSASRHLDFNLALKNTVKDGQQPWAGDFGQSNAVELALPVDTRTTELGASAEWANDRGLLRIGYDGSYFRNHLTTLVWDNPQRLTDATTAPARGRASIWPNSNLNAATMNGLVKLPGRSQATGYVSVGRWTQNDPLIPYTINSVLPTIPLDRTTAQADARVTSTTFSFNTRPTRMLWFNARFRSYDFDNRTPVFRMPQYVAYDTSVSTFAKGANSPYGYLRKTIDADASVTPVAHAAFRAGYTRETIHQTYRAFDQTTEDTVRLSADATNIGWLTVRGVYEHGRRVGSGFDETALDDIGEQVSLRQFDISSRDSDRVSAIAIVVPFSSLSLNGAVSAGREKRPQSVFGLQSNDNHAYTVGFDYVPTNAVSVGVSYNHEIFNTLQRSRQANPGPQFNDPTRDWTTNGADSADTLTASMDLLKLLPKTDVRVGYNYSKANSTYVFGLTPDTTLGPITQLPTVMNKFQRGTVDVRRAVAPHVSAGLVYWYDKYEVNDFTMGPKTLTSNVQGAFMMLGYLYRPYTASTLSARVTYFW